MAGQAKGEVMGMGYGCSFCLKYFTDRDVHEVHERDCANQIIVCPLCGGRGSQTLHGAAYTQDEMYELGEDFIEDYRDGVYDHPCDHCGGKNVTTNEEWVWFTERRHEIEMGY